MGNGNTMYSSQFQSYSSCENKHETSKNSCVATHINIYSHDQEKSSILLQNNVFRIDLPKIGPTYTRQRLIYAVKHCKDNQSQIRKILKYSSLTIVTTIQRRNIENLYLLLHNLFHRLWCIVERLNLLRWIKLFPWTNWSYFTIYKSNILLRTSKCFRRPLKV